MRTILLVAGALVAAGTVASVSAPRSVLDDLRYGASRLGQRVGAQLRVMEMDAEGLPPFDKGKRQRDRTRKSAAADADDAEAADVAEDAQDEPRGGRRSRRAGRRAQDEDGFPPQRAGRRGDDRYHQAEAADDEDAGDHEAAPARARSGRRSAAREDAEENSEAGQPPIGGRVGRSGGRSDDRRFKRLDRDGDGAITPQEFEQAALERIPATSKRFFERFDINGDGKVTRQEFNQASDERFAAIEDDDTAADSGRQPRVRGRDRMR
jgi:hypothetical protein